MKLTMFALTILVAASCMKTRKEYEEAISDIRQKQEETAPENPQRDRGSNDREGMGMDE